MQKTLTRHGNSLALVIDKPILELLKIEPETPLELSTDGKVLIITPVRMDDSVLQNALAKVNKRYAKTLKKLAE